MADDTILIVDDHPVNMTLIRILLAAEGYEIRSACDDEFAARAFRQTEFAM